MQINFSEFGEHPTKDNTEPSQVRLEERKRKIYCNKFSNLSRNLLTGVETKREAPTRDEAIVRSL